MKRAKPLQPQAKERSGKASVNAGSEQKGQRNQAALGVLQAQCRCWDIVAILQQSIADVCGIVNGEAALSFAPARAASCLGWSNQDERGVPDGTTSSKQPGH
jgi:phage I-like protein